jgi:outer membrane immunogenic protein
MRTRLAGAAVAAALTATAAAAGSPTPYTALSWMGPYLGGNLGYQRGAPGKGNADPAGTTGGGQARHGGQAGQFVFGAQTDRPFSNAGDTFANYKFSNPWFGMLRGRGGLALSNILFYGTLGLAYGRGQAGVQAGATENNLHTGLAAGFGLEGGLTQNWPAKAGYLYIDFGGATDDLIGTSNG